uniref:protein-serine/threonine phosphatase n=1 Tax=Oncorhynchus tshawytscha TaxID=74940 RepID=A0A8C8LPR2_ONCTS
VWGGALTDPRLYPLASTRDRSVSIGLWPLCDPVFSPISISESFLTVKGAAVFLPRGNGSSPSSAPRISQQWNKHTGDLQQHLQAMFTVLRPEDNIRLAVRLESAYAQPQCTRYMVVVSTNGRQDTEESVVLGLDFGSSDSSCTMGLVLPLWSDTLIHLDGDGGFSVSTVNRVHVFKPVSVQAMWSALQSLHKACEVARCHNYYPGSLFLTWVSYYQSQVSSDQVCINEWNAMQDVQSHRADSPILFTDVPTERERTERLIKTRLREIMMQKDLENVTSKEIRTELEMQMVCNLREFKEFIDNEMIVILGQMDSPTEIFDHVYLGSEWNASNLEELQTSGVRYILNVTREIDNFFPGVFEYHNIRVYDEEATNLLEYWNDTYKFITKARKAGAKCLVHCKMGVSRSASTVIAYAMKEYGWDLESAFDYVKERRGVTKPNPSFMKQLEEYQGILLASKQRHNKLWRSHSDSYLSERHESPLCKTGPPSHTLGLSDPHNNNNNGPTPSLQHFLLQALGAANDPDNNSEVVSQDTLESSDDSDTLGRSLSDPLSERGDSVSMMSPGIPMAVSPLTPTTPGSLGPYANDDNNNPCGDTDTILANPVGVPTSSNLGTDSIDFFSAREKFLGLSQDGKTRTLSEQMAQRTPQSRCPSQELQPLSPENPAGALSPHTEDGSDRASQEKASSPPHHDNGVSVRHIVTEIESISHPPVAAPLSSTQPAPHSPQQLRQDDRDEETPLTSSYPQSPSTPPSDWPAGSVRRATKQLEQRLRQELDLTLSNMSTQRSPLLSPSAEFHPTGSPLHSPSAEFHPTGSPLHSPSAEFHPTGSPLHSPIAEFHPTGSLSTPPLQSSTPRAPLSTPPVQSSTPRAPLSTPPVQSSTPRAPLSTPPVQSSTPRAPLSTPPVQSSTPRAPLPQCRVPPHGLHSPLPSAEFHPTGSPLHSPSAEFHPTGSPLHSPSAEFHPTGSPLHSPSAEFHPTGSPLHSPSAEFHPTGSLSTPPVQSSTPRAPLSTPPTPVWQRAMEIEARIRQAGLTPPSLMKRSASLAKLDCLELSANDLNDWDLRPTTASPHGPQLMPTPHPRSHHHPSPDDVSKKQRVLSRAPLGGVYPLDSDRTDRGSQRAGSDPPCLSSPPCLVLQGDGELETDPSPRLTRTQSPASAPEVTMTTAQQQPRGKSHPLRRLRKAADKKRTATVLYHTM